MSVKNETNFGTDDYLPRLVNIQIILFSILVAKAIYSIHSFPKYNHCEKCFKRIQKTSNDLLKFIVSSHLKVRCNILRKII